MSNFVLSGLCAAAKTVESDMRYAIYFWLTAQPINCDQAHKIKQHSKHRRERERERRSRKKTLCVNIDCVKSKSSKMFIKVQ